MKKMMVVLVNEIVTILSRPSFWLASLGLPLVGMLIFGGIGWLNRNSSAAQTVSQALTGPQATVPEGYVDLSGIIRAAPEGIPSNMFVAFSDEASARSALAAGEIGAFYIVPQDYVQKGEIIYVRPDFNPLATDTTQSSLFQWILQVNLLGGDIVKASLVNGPRSVEGKSLAATPQATADNPLAYWTPYAITMLFYILIIGSASLLLNNISKEKENRVIEILLTSVTPTQLLAGKIIGLGIVGLGQAILWLGTSMLLLNRGGQTLQLVSSIHLPTSFLTWGLVFFLLGYAIYASLMAGLGALAPNLREASQATFVILLPLMIPLFLSSSVFMEAPNGAIATILSLFPLCAPVAMMARLSAGGVPWWQPWLSMLLLAGTAVLIVRGVAGMFRAQALLSGQEFKVRKFFQALFGRI
jgi:ABC-2 type transport system permease protein